MIVADHGSRYRDACARGALLLIDSAALSARGIAADDRIGHGDSPTIVCNEDAAAMRIGVVVSDNGPFQDEASTGIDSSASGRGVHLNVGVTNDEASFGVDSPALSARIAAGNCQVPQLRLTGSDVENANAVAGIRIAVRSMFRVDCYASQIRGVNQHAPRYHQLAELIVQRQDRTVQCLSKIYRDDLIARNPIGNKHGFSQTELAG